jgi:hypothetical protein
MVSEVLLVVLHVSVPVHCAADGLAASALTARIAAAMWRIRTIGLSFLESPDRRSRLPRHADSLPIIDSAKLAL